MHIIDRALVEHIHHSLQIDRVTAIMGPRQSGKTTLVRHLLRPERPLQYYNLKDPDVRRMLSESAKQEFEYYRECTIVLDEVQQLAALMEIVQLQVDRYADRKGQFLLLGSNHLLLNRRIKESLAGRVALFTLLPLSLSEWAGTAESLYSRITGCESLRDVHRTMDGFYCPYEDAERRSAVWAALRRYGGYPEFLTRENAEDRQNWLSAYRQTYLETDLRELAEIRNPESFERFEKLFASRIGSLLNINELARDAAVSADTIRRFIGYYRQLFITWEARPWHSNISKRTVKMPKWYFYDTGLLRSVMGDFTSDSGHLFENTVLSELKKAGYLKTLAEDFHFVRSASGVEADALFLSRKGALAFFAEIKQSSTPHPADIRHLKKFVSLADHHLGLLLNNSRSIQKLDDRIWSVPAAWLF